MVVVRRVVLACLLFVTTFACSQNSESPRRVVADTPVGKQTVTPPQELEGLYTLASYRAMKHSFILGLETRAKMTPALMPGQRLTVMDTQGCGSIRHIWQTDKRTPLRFECFVDGETTPSVAGLMPELARAAARCNQPFVENPGGISPKKSYNLYVPIPFEKSIRIDVVAPDVPLDELSLNFLQIEYRLDDPSLKGVRLRYENGTFRYDGLDKLPPKPTPKPLEIQTQRFTMKSKQRVKVTGPGIIRSLTLEGPINYDLLRIYFDGDPTPAVDVLARDFFGEYALSALQYGTCRLPMPFKQSAEFEIESRGRSSDRALVVGVESVPQFSPDWGYFHAKWHIEPNTTGYCPYPVLFTKGRGQFIGMALYNTGHDHGGGDFMVVDSDTVRPDFLHGTNGEDYFAFAWFAVGLIPPYAQSINNVLGRVRFHLENPVPFRDSIEVSWGTLEHLQTRSVAYWYQDSPTDLTRMGDAALARTWDVFGPVTVQPPAGKPLPDLTSADALFAGLPTEADLDAGKSFPIEHRYHDVYTGSARGWAHQRAVDNHLNLMYIYRHTLNLGERSHMGVYPRSMMARTTIASPSEQPVTFQLSYDDPIEVRLNGAVVHTDMTVHHGFTTQTFNGTLRAGDNRLLVRMLDTANWDTGWATLNLRVLDAQGKELP